MEPYANEGPCTAETSRTLCTVEKRAGKSGSVLQPATPDFLCQVGDLTKSNDAGRVSTSDEKAVHKHTGPGTLSKANASTSHRFFMEDDAAVQAAADEHVPAKNAIRHRRQRKLLNLHARLDEQQSRERTAINTLQGQLTKLKLMASQLEISIGKHVSSVHATTALSSSDISAAVSLSASSGCSQFDASATAYVVPHKFSEMPQSYSLHNLNCKSIVRADGTNHSYFTLPEDYPLERDVPAPVFDVYDSDGCSNEFVHVFSSTPEQQSYEEEEEQDSEQLLKCVGKAPETEHTPKYFSNPSENEIPSQPPVSATDQMQFEIFDSTPKYDVYEKEDSACLNTTSNVQDFTSEQQPYKEQQESGQLLKCIKAPETEQTIAYLNYLTDVQQQHSVQKASVHVQQLRDPQSNVLVIHERRKEWDPGASALLHSVNCKSHEELGYVAMLDPKALNLCNQVGTCVQQLVTHASEKEWDPGDTNLHFLFTTAASATELECTDVYKSPMVQVLAVQLSVRRAPISESALMRSYAFGLGWTEVNASVLFVLVVPCFRSTSAAKRSLLLSSGGNNRTSHSILNLFMQSLCATTAVQVTDCMQYIASNGINHVLHATALIMQSAPHLSQGNYLCFLYCNSVLQIEYHGMRYVWAFPLEKGRQVQWDPGIESTLYELWWLSKGTGYVLRHLLAVKFGTHNYTYFSYTAASMYCPPANLIQQRNIAALLQFCHCILLSSDVCVWDPGIAFVYRKGVQKNYSATNLLFSENYLRTWEMDIIFITFLPP